MNESGFISYSRTDGESLAARLDRALSERGYRTWRDTREIDAYQ